MITLCRYIYITFNYSIFTLESLIAGLNFLDLLPRSWLCSPVQDFRSVITHQAYKQLCHELSDPQRNTAERWRQRR